MNNQRMYVRVAQHSEIDEAHALCDRAYRGAGYLGENTSSPIARNDHARVLSAFVRTHGTEQMIGTVTLEHREDLLQSSWALQFLGVGSALSSIQGPVGLLSRLAVLREQRRSYVALLKLMDAVLHECERLALRHIVCAVHPKHVSFYEHLFGFEVVASGSNMPGLVRAPVRILSADFVSARTRYDAWRSLRSACKEACPFSESTHLDEPVCA